MYIKQIIIQGFKSYKDQTVIEPFSPKTNVIVGRNGSGKSNFFAAIRFVLSDAYTQMGREERQGLLHEGSGSAVTSAYVEVIFDNSDDRFPTGNKEVVLRRTIGSKKDEYSVDRKVVTKSDVTNLLEAAGFSRSNPYYIVPQGRVTALTNMKESDRLNLLKEVAGTQVYEARRTESLKIMNETNNKREKIDELLEYIKERLAELEEEKEELRGYQEKDREKRCLEYAYHFREKASIEEHLEDIDNARQTGLDTSDSSQAELLEGQNTLARLDAEAQKLQRKLELLQIERRQLEEDRRDSAKSVAKKEMKVKDLRDGQSSLQQAREVHESQLETVKSDLARKEKELSKVTPDFNKNKTKEDDVKRQLDAADASRSRLFAKQGRGSQFKNKRDRDAYFQREIEELNNTIMEHKANKIDADEEVTSVQQGIALAEKDVTELRSRLQNWNGGRDDLVEVATQAHDRRDRLNDERKLLRREEEKLNSEISNTRQELQQAEKEMNHTMKRDTARGLDSIRRLKQDRDIPGTFGILADLFEVNDAYRVAVEQTAGGRLFNYVVDNDDTATELLNALHKQHGGRVTCLPISRVRPKKVNVPKAQDAVPLLSKIKYDPNYETVFQWVFGHTVVCQNLAVAAQYSRSHGVNAITIDGDTTNPRGAMSGGWIDPGKSMLKSVWAANKWRDEYEKLMDKSVEIRQQIDKKDQEITAAMSELQKAEQTLRQSEDGFEPAQQGLRRKLADLENERTRLDSARRRREVVDTNMNRFISDREAYEAEMQTEFKKSLTAAEEKQLADLSTTVQELREQWNQLSRTRRELESRKQILETDIRQNLQLKLDELNGQAFEYSSSGATASGVSEAQKELKKAQKALQTVDSSLGETERKTEKVTERMEEIVGQRSSTEQSQVELKGRLERDRKKVEKALQQKNLLMARLTDCTKNIRDLGVLPEEAFDKYEQMNTTTINNRLKKVNEALKKYKHVNKKAFEQYNSFTNQQDQLMKRRKELDDSQTSIEELVEHLDRRKDEAIERTFKQVSKEFSTIFAKLVPAGHGRLVIQRRADRRQEPEESDEDNRAAVENYTGVGISVSFNSKHLDEQQRIQQLSGGQKSLCALCLIFALQQTESSPMVIFDEVDANLDAQYRTAVAALLQSISDEAGTQFICTTFRPEIVHIADKSYGVTFRNKTSSINCVSTEDALEFVEGQAAPTQ